MSTILIYTYRRRFSCAPLRVASFAFVCNKEIINFDFPKLQSFCDWLRRFNLMHRNKFYDINMTKPKTEQLRDVSFIKPMKPKKGQWQCFFTEGFLLQKFIICIRSPMHELILSLKQLKVYRDDEISQTIFWAQEK